MNIDFDMSHIISGFAGAFVLYLILRYGHDDDEEETGDSTTIRVDNDAVTYQVDDLLHRNSPLSEDMMGGYFLWEDEPYIRDDQQVLYLLYEAVERIKSSEVMIEATVAENENLRCQIRDLKRKLSPTPPPLTFPELTEVETPEPPVLTEEVSTPELTLVDNRSEVETKLAPKNTGRPLSSPYDAWMFPSPTPKG